MHIDIKENNFFHDGTLIDVEKKSNEIILSLESSEILTTDNKDNIPLSKRNTLRGKLHIVNPKQVNKNSITILDFNKNFDDSEILNFDFYKNKIEIVLETIFLESNTTDVVIIEIIDFDSYYWENIPSLPYPLYDNK